MRLIAQQDARREQDGHQQEGHQQEGPPEVKDVEVFTLISILLTVEHGQPATGEVQHHKLHTSRNSM